MSLSFELCSKCFGGSFAGWKKRGCLSAARWNCFHLIGAARAEGCIIWTVSLTGGQWMDPPRHSPFHTSIGSVYAVFFIATFNRNEEGQYIQGGGRMEMKTASQKLQHFRI